MSCYRGSRHIPDLSLATQPGTRYAVEWVDVPDRDAPEPSPSASSSPTTR